MEAPHDADARSLATSHTTQSTPQPGIGLAQH